MVALLSADEKTVSALLPALAGRLRSRSARPCSLTASGIWCHSADTNSPRGYAVTTTSSSDVYYDTYDVGINADPYPVYRRLREEAPVYYNDKHDFFAVSHFADVEKGLLDAQTYISGKGGIIELIKADIEMPPGVIIFEDPPTHTIHRRLLSRAFTPRRVAELEPKIREFCAHEPRPARSGRTASTSSPTWARRCRCG